MKIYLSTLSALTLCLSLSPLRAEPYEWKAKDGERSILAEFVSRDETSVVIRKTNGSAVTVKIDELHTASKNHLNQNHPLGGAKREPEPAGDAFGPLNFGDSREEVEEKLVNSTLVTTKVDETLFGRTGLNGIFETAIPLGGLPCFLYFDWNESGNLHEITIRTKGVDSSQYNGKLRSTWSETVATLEKLYGKPLSGNSYPKQDDLENGLMLASHLWRNTKGSILLGPGQEHTGYNVSIRFVDKLIQPVATP
ncbi:MAG: hypothetical protein ACSHYB_02830 [Roseibacillus sp.]